MGQYGRPPLATAGLLVMFLFSLYLAFGVFFGVSFGHFCVS